MDELIAFCQEMDRLVLEKGWARLTGNMIRQRIEPYPTLAPVIWHKEDILREIGRVAERALTHLVVQPGSPVKEVLLEGLLLLLDAWAPYKPLLEKISRDTPRHFFSFAVMQQIEGMLASLFEAATVSTASLQGVLRVKGLGVVFLLAFSTWLKDETPGNEKTMALLDLRLSQAQEIAGYLSI